MEEQHSLETILQYHLINNKNTMVNFKGNSASNNGVAVNSFHHSSVTFNGGSAVTFHSNRAGYEGAVVSLTNSG